MENEGAWLFKRRGQLPFILFLFAIPACYYGGQNLHNPKEEFLINAIGVLLSSLGFLLRVYTVSTTPKGTSGRNTTEQIAEVLNTRGSYSVVRHPLYLANYLMWMGIVITTHSSIFFLIMSLIYWLYYERIMIAEEQFLLKKFGKDFEKWSFEVPAFLPHFRKFIKSDVSFSLKTVLRREYSGLIAMIAGFAIIEILRHYFRYEEWRLSTLAMIFMVLGILLALLLRVIKYSTRLLYEEERS